MLRRIKRNAVRRRYQAYRVGVKADFKKSVVFGGDGAPPVLRDWVAEPMKTMRDFWRTGREQGIGR